MCRKKFTVPARGWKHLPRNYIVEKLLSASSGKAAVKNSRQEAVAVSVDRLSKSVNLEIEKCQRLVDRLDERATYLPQKSQNVKQEILRRCEELKKLIESNAEELVTKLDQACELTLEKLAAEQGAMKTRCSELKIIQNKLKEIADASDVAEDHLEAIAAEMKPLMSEAKCDTVDADISFIEAQLQMAHDTNFVGRVQICNNMQKTRKCDCFTVVLNVASGTVYL